MTTREKISPPFDIRLVSVEGETIGAVPPFPFQFSCRLSCFHVHSPFLMLLFASFVASSEILCDDKKRQKKITNNIL
jgi:hypothetical protein